jgi:TolA-binding protein
MAARVLVIWSLVLVTLWMGVFGFFNKYFDGSDFERARVARLEKKLQQNEHMLARSTFLFSEYKDALVAQGIKIDSTTKWSDPRRAIASVMADSDYRDLPKIQPGSQTLNKGKELFVAGDFKRSSELLDDFIRQNPDHPDLPEAAYLLVESFYMTGQIDRCINEVDFLTVHFPETEYSALALVRLGKIFESQDRADEAIEIYELVIKNFKNSNGAILAEKLRKEVSI